MTPARTRRRGQTGAACAVADSPSSQTSHPTIWGLTPLQLHDRYWASRGVQVVRRDSQEPISPHASLYLLSEHDTLALFDVPDTGRGLTTELLYVRVRDVRERGLREHVVTDAADRFVRFERMYDRPQSRTARAALTRNPALAASWQAVGSWKAMRRAVSKPRRRTIECDGKQFDCSREWEVAAFVRDLANQWHDPSPAIGRVNRVSDGIWRDRDATIHPHARLVRPVWIGRGRQAAAGTMVVGPTILWDDPNHRPTVEPFAWETATIAADGAIHKPAASANERRVYRFSKRIFDIVFSLFALAVTLPLYPIIILAIVLEDGWPPFFRHRRETVGGREFDCLKFRSMRRNADAMKSELASSNQADGPQFYIHRDPRLTRVGRFLRRSRIDEWPQFFNVLAGHMSIVGPRPSPFKENQFCPAWRKLRLSVRPGITGLWQVKRTRRRGADFQEWIRYDIEYVETAGWTTDMAILWRTVMSMLFK